jgi:hypothetical protein
MKPDEKVPYTGEVAEVRYSLPVLLREVEIERAAPIFAMEKLDQAEIRKLFPRNNRRRAAAKRK